MKKSTKVIGSIITGAILVGLAVLSKDEPKGYAEIDCEDDENDIIDDYEMEETTEPKEIFEGEVEA